MDLNFISKPSIPISTSKICCCFLNVKTFKTEEEAKAATEEGCSAIGHGTKGPYVGYKTQPVECIADAIKDACKELKLKVDLGFEWIPGLTWGQCH